MASPQANVQPPAQKPDTAQLEAARLTRMLLAEAWLPRVAFMSGCLAAAVAFGAARVAERAILTAVFCACVAAVISAAASVVFGRILIAQEIK